MIILPPKRPPIVTTIPVVGLLVLAALFPLHRQGVPAAPPAVPQQPPKQSMAGGVTVKRQEALPAAPPLALLPRPPVVTLKVRNALVPSPGPLAALPPPPPVPMPPEPPKRPAIGQSQFASLAKPDRPSRAGKARKRTVISADRAAFKRWCKGRRTGSWWRVGGKKRYCR